MDEERKQKMRMLNKMVKKWPNGDVSESAAMPGYADSPWPARDVVEKLIEATDILLNEKDYDGHGWEQIQVANQKAKEWLAT